MTEPRHRVHQQEELLRSLCDLLTDAVADGDLNAAVAVNDCIARVLRLREREIVRHALKPPDNPLL